MQGQKSCAMVCDVSKLPDINAMLIKRCMSLAHLISCSITPALVTPMPFMKILTQSSGTGLRDKREGAVFHRQRIAKVMIDNKIPAG